MSIEKVDFKELREFVEKLSTDAERVVEWNINEVDEKKAEILRNRLWTVCDELEEWIDEQSATS